MDSGLRIVATTTASDLEAHAAAWDDLAARAPQRLPMLSAAWVIPFLRHRLEGHERWVTLFAYRGDTLAGVLPVVKCGRRFGRLVLRTPWDFHTRSGDLLLSADAPEVPDRLLAGLEPHLGPWFSLTVRGVSAQSPTPALLSQSDVRTFTVTLPEDAGSFFEIGTSLEECLAPLGQNFRHNLRKARNRLSQLRDVHARFLTGALADEAALERFIDLEASGWKGAGGTAIKNSGPLLAFYEDLCRRLSALGWLEFHFLEAEGRTIAGHLAVRIADSIVLVKIAYDEGYSRYSPGNMLFERTVQHVLETGGVSEINCLTDMPWHRNWRMARRPFHSLTIYPRQIVPWVSGALPDRTRQWLRRVPGARRLYRALSSRAER